MTQPIRRRGVPTFADVVATEQAQVAAGTPACGHTCDCHGGYVCVRTADHVTAGQMMRESHAGRDADGGLVHWTVDTCPTPEDHAVNLLAAKAAQAEHTRAFLAGLDPDVLREFLTARGA